MICVCSILLIQGRNVWLRTLQGGWNMSTWQTLPTVLLPGKVWESRNIINTGRLTPPHERAFPLWRVIWAQNVIWPESIIKGCTFPVIQEDLTNDSKWQHQMVFATPLNTVVEWYNIWCLRIRLISMGSVLCSLGYSYKRYHREILARWYTSVYCVCNTSKGIQIQCLSACPQQKDLPTGWYTKQSCAFFLTCQLSCQSRQETVVDVCY